MVRTNDEALLVHDYARSITRVTTAQDLLFVDDHSIGAPSLLTTGLQSRYEQRLISVDEIRDIIILFGNNKNYGINSGPRIDWHDRHSHTEYTSILAIISSILDHYRIAEATTSSQHRQHRDFTQGHHSCRERHDQMGVLGRCIKR